MSENPIRTVVERIRAREAAKLGRAAITEVEIAEPVKTKAELRDELDAAGIEYPKDARKSDLEALLPVATEDIP